MSLCPLWINELTPEMNKKAEEELGETNEIKGASLREFRNLIEAEEGLKVMMDDLFLLRFLRMKKYEVNRSFKTLKNYISFKAERCGVMTDINIQNFNKILEMNKFIIMPKLHPSGSGVLYISMGSIDLDVISLESIASAILAALDIALCNEAMQVCGIKFIVDYSGMSFRLFANMFKPSFIIPSIQAITDTWPCRVKEMHVVNEPPTFGAMYNVCAKPFLSKKLRERLCFHAGNHENLHDHFPSEHLPESLGGTICQKDFNDFRKVMINKEDLLEKLNSYVCKGKTFPVCKNL